jgi:hypothetical protein
MSNIELIRLIVDQLLYWEVGSEPISQLVETLLGKNEANHLINQRQPSNKLEELVTQSKRISFSEQLFFEPQDMSHEEGDLNYHEEAHESQIDDEEMISQLRSEDETSDKEESIKKTAQANGISKDIQGIDNLEVEKDQRKLINLIGRDNFLDPSFFLFIYIDILTSKELHFNTSFITTHKGPCRVATFSPDGKWAATGSEDTSVKLLDVAKMNQKADSSEERPVTRTLYDHTQVNGYCLTYKYNLIS